MTLSHFILRPYGGDMKLPGKVFGDILDVECNSLLNKGVLTLRGVLPCQGKGRKESLPALIKAGLSAACDVLPE